MTASSSLATIQIEFSINNERLYKFKKKPEWSFLINLQINPRYEIELSCSLLILP